MNNMEFISEHNNTNNLITQDDGFCVSSLVERVQESDRTYESRQLRFHESYVDFTTRPNFRNQTRMREALSTNDMPLLFADTMNRTLLGSYQTVALPDFRPYVAVGRFNSTFEKPYYGLEFGSKALDPVNQLGEYKERGMREEEFKYRIRKYGNRFAFSMEFFLTQDTDLFNRSMAALGVAARRREYRVATELFVDANGPHASLYKSNYSWGTNIVPSNPVFGPAGFEAAMNLLKSQVDADGEPIVIELAHLVIPPALEARATQMFGAEQWEITLDGRKALIANPYRGTVRVHVNPYIPVIANNANGATSWFLFASPNIGRPAVEVGYLTGFEAPQLFIKEPNARRVGGGSNIFDGSFENDSLENKIRMFIGGTRFEPRSTVASNGSGV